MQRNEIVYTLAQDWKVWLSSKRLLSPPMPKGILDKLLETVKPEPKDRDFNPYMVAFNMAYVQLDESMQIPFLYIYCDLRVVPVKTIAHKLGIERVAFYLRAHEAARKIKRNADKIHCENVLTVI